MKKKYNNQSKYFKDWTTSKLKSEAKILDDLIYGKNPCFGTRDVKHLYGILSELESRGFVPFLEMKF